MGSNTENRGLYGGDVYKRQALNKAGMDPDEPFLLERFEVVRHHECGM